MTNLDTSLFHFINRDLAHPWLDALMKAIYLGGEWIALLILVIPLVALRGNNPNRRLAWLLIPLPVFTDALASYLKFIFARPRPFLTLDTLLLLPTDGLSIFSFPSGHGINGFALATLAALIWRRPLLWAFLIAGAVLNAFSRVYLGVHYPGDVMAGGLLGVGCAYVVFVIARRSARRTLITGIVLVVMAGFFKVAVVRGWHPPVEMIPTTDAIAPLTDAGGEPSSVSRPYGRQIGNSGSPAPGQNMPPASSPSDMNALDRLLAGKSPASRTLELPPAPAEEPVAEKEPEKPKTEEELKRAEGRKKRENLPMGVVLANGVAVYSEATGGKKIFEMMTGDFVRVFSDKQGGRIHVHPGLDVYLAATTRETRPAGERLPDQDGWVESDQIHVFNPEQAREFIFDTTPMTLGSDPNFSTYSFYERAMKNPDPVVHRVMGPRLIALADLHEDYVSSWSGLYRDRDSAVRAAALAALRQRGVGQSRRMIEDLITRVAELTRLRVRGESEAEVLLILDILKASAHPRVPAAMASFQESWQKDQGPALNQALEEILKQ